MAVEQDYSGELLIFPTCGQPTGAVPDVHAATWRDVVPDHTVDDRIVVSDKFAVKIPQGARLEKVAPLLCAGITTYSPLRYAGVKKRDRVGVAGFGGLGQMVVQYAVAFGAEVTVFDISEDKRDAAAELGAVRYVNVNKASELQGLHDSFDFIISTIPAGYDPAMYMKMLKVDGQLAIVGLPAFDKMPAISI